MVNESAGWGRMKGACRMASLGGAAVLSAITLAACGQHSAECYEAPSDVVEVIARGAPGLEFERGMGVPGPESDGFFYIALTFTMDGVTRGGVWGYSTWDEVMAVDEVAAEVSDWPDHIESHPAAGTDKRSAEAAMRCLESG